MANIAERNIIFRIQTDTAKARKDIESVKKDVTGLNGVVRNAAANFAGLAAFDVAGRLVGGLRSLTDQSIKLALASEQTTVSFETFLGSAQRARQVLAELREFSTLTPFEPEQVIQAGKALLAFGIEADKLTDTLKIIGDVSAGTGKDFNELAVIFGKARTQGTLFAEDINQLTEAGIPIIGEFAKQFGVAESQVKKLVSEGKVGFADLEQAFINLTSEGGKFFDLTARQSQTVAGRISTLVGNFNALVQSVGERLLPVIGSLVDSFSGFVTLAREFVDTPVSEQLEQERIELNLLVLELVDANTEEARRSQIIDQLQKQYPGFLQNIDAETASNEELTTQLREVNKLFVARILLQQQEERLEKARLGAAVQRGDQFRAEQRVRTEILAINKALGESLQLENKTLEEQAQIARQAAENAGGFSSEIRRLDGFLRLLQQQTRGATSALEDANDAEKELLQLQKDLQPELDQFNKLFGEQERQTTKATNAVKALSKEERKLAEQRRKIAEQLGRQAEKDTASQQDRLRQEVQDDIDAEKKRTDDFISEQQRRNEAFQQNQQDIIEAGDEAQREAESADEAEIAAEEEKNRKKKEQREKDLQNAKENREKIIQVSIDTANTIIDIAEQQTQAQIDQLDILLDAQRERVANAVLTAERGNAELLQAEEDRLEALTAARERAAERQRQIAAIQATANQIVAASQGIVAVTRAFAEGSFVEGIATSVALAAQVAAIIAQINQAGNQVQGFADGTDFVNGPGGSTSDSVPAMLSRGERVVPANINSRYYDALNEFQRGTPKADMMAAMMRGGGVATDTSKIESELVMMNQRLESLEMNVTLDSKGFSASLQKYQSNQFRKRKLT